MKSGRPIHAQIAEQLQALLSAAELSRPLDPMRTYNPTGELTDKKLRLQIFPKGETRRRLTRASNLHSYDLGVAVLQKVDPADAAQGDEITALLEEIVGHVDRHWYLEIEDKLVDFLSAEIVLFFPQQLQEQRHFTSLITFKFQLERKR